MTSRDTRHAGLTIGQFARRSGLSHNALRLYDLSGLLPPARVDEDSGYRYYSSDQLERARRISQLRQLDMPLATVAEVLADGDAQALSRLDRWWAAQEAAMRSRRAAVEYLHAQWSHGGAVPPRYEVRLRTVAATKVATISAQVDQSTLVDTMNGARDRIDEHLRGAGARPTGEAWWVFHGMVTPDSEAAVEVCVPFDGTVDPAGPITIRMDPAHTEAYCAVTRDECSYPRIMAAYDAVHSWVREAGRRPSGPTREVYCPGGVEAAGDQPFALVAQPVEVEV
jgi:DNA-binding transcriptional MerR regulator